MEQDFAQRSLSDISKGELPGSSRSRRGAGDVLTGLFAPLVAYWWVAGKPYARTAAIALNLFGMADLVNAVVLGALTGGGGGAKSLAALDYPRPPSPHAAPRH